MYRTDKRHSGFSLAEVIATLVVGAIVLSGVVGIYMRAKKTSVAAMEKMDEFVYPAEVLQKIAEDVEKIFKSGGELESLFISNGIEEGYPTARIEMSRDIVNAEEEKEEYEIIAWEGAYAFESEKPGLVLYRSHSGMFFEDRLLEQNRQDWERGLYVPVSEGVSLFEVLAVDGERVLDAWNQNKLPAAIKIRLSFGEPVETITGDVEIIEEEVYERTIQIDPDRKIKLKVIALPDVNDVNDVDEDEEEDEEGEEESGDEDGPDGSDEDDEMTEDGKAEIKAGEERVQR